MTEKQKKQLCKILVAAIICIPAIIISMPEWAKLILYLIGYLVVGLEILKKAVKNIKNGQVFDENFLMSIATIGAFLLGEYLEGIAVMLFYQIGELFQSYAVNQSRKSISDLMDIRPDSAVVLRDSQEEVVDPEEVMVGEIIVVRPGEKVPLDGIVIEGSSTLDTAALTGESVPRTVVSGETIISGCINLTGILKIRVEKEFEESTVAKILDLVENASSQKAKVENFITRFARYYTPVVVMAAAVLAVIPPLFLPNYPFADWIYRALTFLVISCPCALVISIPLSFFGGIGAASKYGVLVKGSNYLELLSNAEFAVFDKTGTLTEGSFRVSEIVPEGMKQEDLLGIAAYAEAYSNHPISQSILEAYGRPIDKEQIHEMNEIVGRGVWANVGEIEVYAGNAKLMQDIGVVYPKEVPVGTIVHIAVDHVYAGYLLIADIIKSDAKKAIEDLKKVGVKKTVMLTGDTDAIGRKVAEKLNMDEVYTQLLPADKVARIESLLERKSQNGYLVFVGDGINDAPVLARADVGVAMGGLGCDAAIEAADVVIMTDEPSKLAGMIKIARKTVKICRQNIVFALGVKAVILVLGAFGIADMWAAVFGDVGVAVLAILNSMRTLYMKNKE
ncbi:Cadmium, zinc and cobalt-transporting ATPase [Clostridiales bacterium CHKCI001]|nr:Cadmium, zinc and cobalt-transporting ATPase [Clostridiales bacterium CHKCI001]